MESGQTNNQPPKIGKCQWCGEEGFLLKHHEKYEQRIVSEIVVPEEIIWICKKCHYYHHRHAHHSHLTPSMVMRKLRRKAHHAKSHGV